jgi:predicted metalloprotease with PDZ domain
VRTSHLDGTHGYFNGANVFMYMPGRTAEPLGLLVQTPPEWKWHVTTGLDEAPRGDDEPADTHHFIASDYDELVDSPVECGIHRLLTFSVDDIPHRIAIWGRGNEDEQRIVDDTRRIIETQRDLFGGLPYNHYTFILHLAERYGGLEHRNSASNIIDRWSFQSQSGYERFLELQSHEFFHTWNVKRIRPAVLGPFDYQHENYTRLLWAMEGVTSYYDRLMLVRAGLMHPERYLDTLTDDICKLQRSPGRKLHSLEESSFDAWIKFYRRNEHTDNSTVSYYLKGGLVILLLDLEIRHRTGGKRSFDDVLRYLFTTYPISGPGIPEEGAYLDAIEQVAGSAEGAYRDFFARYVAGTEELAYEHGFSHVGLRLEWGHSAPVRGDHAPAWLGASLKNRRSRTVVTSVRSDGPAYTAGISADDELLALDGFRVDDSSLSARLRERSPGDIVTLSLFRRDELLHVPVALAEAPYDTLKLQRIEQADALQEQLYQQWLRANQ